MLCPQGLCPDVVAKLDCMKLEQPTEWGWRFFALDFVMPNHQLVSCYVVFAEMELTQQNQDPDAHILKELSNRGKYAH